MPTLVADPPFVEKLTAALRSRLEKAGLNVDVSSEPVHFTKLYRFYVVSRNFKAMGQQERQKLVWHIVENVLSADEQLHVSMILTVTPDDLGH